MASPALDLEDISQESPPDAACREAQKWIEQVTGRSFGDKDFRTGLENGVLLCELLNAIKPGLIKKINRLPTPIAGLDNVSLFLRGCKELGLKESQLFDPGDLQDNSNRTTVRLSDCNRKLRNVLVTVYWLGKAANSCASHSGNHLDLKEFEGLLAQMRKENEEVESPKRSIRDSGYIDCWDSERSDSLSPPRHGRDDSFDSLDSFGSRSQQTPSPDVILRGSSDGRGSDSESDLPHRRLPDVRKDDMSARRVSFGENKIIVPFNQYLPNKSNQTAYIPAPLRKKKAEREDYRKSWSTATSPLGGERPFRSVSMLDMRYEEEGTLIPHSRAHQEHLQFVNDLLKEEDDTWQNDLARWKTRRRSASQDLIKKEEERKKMERLLSGDSDSAERRKSIKTYKEIVEEKERREKELHEAYKNAKTKEEAEKLLQKYIERFTISEAVLERLVMPKILERSQSVEPGLLSSTEDPNPLKYLRQPSVPSPKFTSTVEATISPTSESDFKATAGRTSPTKSVVSKAVPMLMPKPYSQPRSTQQVLKTFKVDGKISVNGEAVNGTEEQKERGSTVTSTFAPSLTRSQRFEGVARVDAPKTELKTDVSSIELSLTRPNVHSPNKDPKVFSEGINHTNQVDELDSSTTENVHSEQTKDSTQPPNLRKEEPTVTTLDSLSVTATEPTVNGKDVEEEQKEDSTSLVMHWSLDSSIKEQNDTALCPDKRKCEDDKDALQKEKHGELEVSGNPSVFQPLLNSPSRFCAWDPEEERRRQERWQQEQERLLQERYLKEQEKLKDEWEKAQKEVEEEERKYYEEERKIIEDTVLPLTVSPVSSVHHSLSETNGSSVSNHSEPGPGVQGEPRIQDVNHLMEDSHSPENKLQTQLLTREVAAHRTDMDQTKRNSSTEIEEKTSTSVKETDQNPGEQHNASTKLHLQLGLSTKSHLSEDVNNCVDNNSILQRMPYLDSKGSDSQDNSMDIGYSSPSPTSQGQSLNRSVSGKKLCSTCGLPLGKGAAMIIETLSLYFHIQCFKCGICKGQLGSATTGTDVRIRNGLLNCNDCYARSRTAGHPTPL